MIQGKAIPFIKGEKIYLREVRISDVNENYYKWINSPNINRFLECRFFPQSIESLRDYVDKMARDQNNLFLAIVLCENDRHIGNIKLGPINWIHRFAEIGILIGETDCWGKGYASEAIRLVVDHGFNQLNLHKITAGCYTTNLGSMKAFQKIGFEIEGKRKDHYYNCGQYIDLILMGLVRYERPIKDKI